MNRVLLLSLLFSVQLFGECPEWSATPYLAKGGVDIYASINEFELDGEFYCDERKTPSIIVYTVDTVQLTGPEIGVATEIEILNKWNFTVYWVAASSFYKTVIELSNEKLVKVSETQVAERP